jgi:DNA polymerase III delta prime subunit
MESPEISLAPREIKERERKEGKKRTEITVELDDLFQRMERESDPVIRDNLAGQIERALERGRRVFEKLGKSGEDELQEYFRRLRNLEKTS